MAVIPTRDEAAALPTLLATLANEPRLDGVVVADCDSVDGTVDLARGAGAMVVQGEGLVDRASAMQAGCEAAMALDPPPDVLWLVHADSGLDVGWYDAIERALAEPGVVAAAMQFTLRTRKHGYLTRRKLRFVRFCNRTRYRLTGVYFGDQSLAVRVEALNQIGGVPQQPLLEDVALCDGLNQVGRVVLTDQQLTTSPRRFLRHGVIRQLLIDATLLTGYRMGWKPERLYGWYNRVKA